MHEDVLDGLVDGKAVIVCRDSSPPLEVIPELLRHLDAPSPQVLGVEQVVRLVEVQPGRFDSEEEELGLTS